MGPKMVPLYGIVWCPLLREVDVLKDMEIWSGYSELSVICCLWLRDVC